MKKGTSKREALKILQAVANAIMAGKAKAEENGGYALTELARHAEVKTKALLKAMRIWFDQKIARFNNKLVHLPRGPNQLQRYVDA